MDLPFTFDFLGANPEPDNALTIAWYVTYKSPPTKCYFTLEIYYFVVFVLLG